MIGGGNIFGPYRGYLYYWRTHDAGLMSATIALLWPWLSSEKRMRTRRTLAAVPALWFAEPIGEIWRSYAEDADGLDERRAWAAGFFEGDGSIGAYVGRRQRSSPPQLSASVSQASVEGIPTCLLRFREVVGAGSILGPVQPRGWSRLPQYRWQLHGKGVENAMTMLMPWLVGAKREQVDRAIGAVSDQPRSSDLITRPAGTFG